MNNFQYITKPVIIEAIRTPTSDDIALVPTWYVEAVEAGVIFIDGTDTLITTRQGAVIINERDWLIRLDDGEIYPCADEIFQKKYRKPLDEV